MYWQNAPVFSSDSLKKLRSLVDNVGFTLACDEQGTCVYHDGEDGDDGAADVATPVTGVSNGMAGGADMSRY